MELSPRLDNPISPDEELAFIRSIIADSRRAFAEDGKPYILWGVLVSLGMTITYISALLQHDFYTAYVWIGLTLIGYAYIFYYVREKKKLPPRAKSFVERIQGSVWGACGSTIGLVVFLIMIKASTENGEPSLSPFYICFFTACITGIGYFLSGIVHDLKWLQNIGYVWWAGAVVMFLWPSVHVLGLYTLMMICFQVVPGIILNRRYRAEQSSVRVEG